MNDSVMTLLVALFIDRAFGDPPNQFHPVAWMGSAIATARKHAPRSRAGRQLIYGGLIVAAGLTLSATCARLFARGSAHLPRPLNWLLTGVLLKILFSQRRLEDVAAEVQEALESDDLPEARRLVGWHLVSRDTTALDHTEIAAATIESLAENASDSVVAPLSFFGLFGLPGAIIYRFANTADAMLGYRDPEREWLGKIPARLDDLFNLIPARLTALLLILSAWLRGSDGRRSARVWRRDRRLTASPNAGHPMSAMAGALGVTLAKGGDYTLGADGRPPQADDIGKAVILIRSTSLLATGLLLLLVGRKDRGRR